MHGFRFRARRSSVLNVYKLNRLLLILYSDLFAAETHIVKESGAPWYFSHIDMAHLIDRNPVLLFERPLVTAFDSSEGQSAMLF